MWYKANQAGSDAIVVLRTAPMPDNATCELTLQNVKDRAVAANTIAIFT